MHEEHDTVEDMALAVGSQPDAGSGQKGTGIETADDSSIFSALDDKGPVKGVVVALLLVLALLSAIPAANHFSSAEAYDHTIASLDQKKNVVTGLIAVSAASSAAISAIPGDAGTPIAEQLAELSQDFLIILTAIYLEKFLLTTFGLVAFRILFPLACLLVVLALLVRKRQAFRSASGQIALKLVLFGAAIVLVVPASILIADMMEDVHNASLSQSLEALEQKAPSLESTSEAESTEGSKDAESAGLLEKLTSGVAETVSGAVDTVTGAIQDNIDKAAALLGNLLDTFALLIVTSCVIPILVMLLLLWVVKILTGVDVRIPGGKRLLRTSRL